jgi:hypothetical protein
MRSMNEDPLALIPELCLLAGALVGLLVGLFVPRRRQWLVRLIAATALVAGITAGLVAMTRPAELIFDESYAVDTGLGVVRVVVLAGTLLTVCLAIDTVHAHGRETEFYVLLLLLGALGSVTLAGASDLMLLGAAYLLASVPLYPPGRVLQGLPGHRGGAEVLPAGRAARHRAAGRCHRAVRRRRRHRLQPAAPAARGGAARRGRRRCRRAAGRAAVQDRRGACPLLGA